MTLMPMLMLGSCVVSQTQVDPPRKECSSLREAAARLRAVCGRRTVFTSDVDAPVADRRPSS
eukprot:3346655-Rhodomonas_salina.2